MARFMTLDEVAEELATTRAQVYAMVRNGSLPSMKIGGRGQWRVERSRLEAWIEQTHAETARFVVEHPMSGAALPDGDDEADGQADGE